MDDFHGHQIKVDKLKQVIVTPSKLSDSCSFQWDGRVLKGEDVKTRVTGKIDAPHTGEQWCVGVVGDDGVVTVHPARTVTLRQSVVGYVETVSALKSNEERYQALIEEFGSAKKRKAVKSREANKVANTLDSKGNYTSYIAPEGTSPEEIATLEWRKTFLPQWDDKAESPRAVYNAEAMAGDGAWKTVTRLSKDDFTSAWMLPSIEALLAKEDATTEQKCCLILAHYFADFYMRFCRRSIPPINYEKKSFYGQPLSIAERFLDKFSSLAAGDRRAMSTANKDSCLVHIFLLFIMACDPMKMESSTIGSLAADMKVEGSSVIQLLRQAGLKVTVNKAKGTVTAKLTVPLAFPAMARRVKRR